MNKYLDHGSGHKIIIESRTIVLYISNVTVVILIDVFLAIAFPADHDKSRLLSAQSTVIGNDRHSETQFQVDKNFNSFYFVNLAV